LPAETGCASGLDGEWWEIDRLDKAGLPSLFMKAARAVLEEGY
jgi:A/G-specific adenine glycosylase